MGELWRRASELFWKHPVLWLPALLADLASFTLGQIEAGMLRRFFLSRMQYHSVLGGAVQHAPMNAAAMQQTTLVGIIVTWSTYYVRILCYVCAFVITAALVSRFLGRMAHRQTGVVAALRARISGILGLGFRTLLIYAAGALTFALVTNELIAHGRGALLRHVTYTGTFLVVLTAALALFLAPVGLRLLMQRTPAQGTSRKARVVALAMGWASIALTLFVSSSGRTIASSAPAQRVVLEALASLLATLPYIVLFIALSLLAEEPAGLAEGANE